MDFSLSGSVSNMHDIYGYFIVSMATAQRWPFRVLRLCMRWANFRETVAGEQPGSNVCRCIPNWGIAFLVIAISICALLSLLSHFKLSLIPLFPSSSLAHRRVLRHTPSLALSLSLSPPPHCLSYPPIFHSPWLTLIRRLNMWVFNTFFSRLWETGRERQVCILIIAPLILSAEGQA